MKSLSEIAELDRGARGGEFVRLAHLMLKHQNSPGDMLQLMERERGLFDRARNVLKAGVPAGALSGDWALVSNVFAASLARDGVFAQMLSSMRRVPLETPNVLVSSSTITGYAVGEGASKPLSSLSFGASGTREDEGGRVRRDDR